MTKSGSSRRFRARGHNKVTAALAAMMAAVSGGLMGDGPRRPSEYLGYVSRKSREPRKVWRGDGYDFDRITAAIAKRRRRVGVKLFNISRSYGHSVDDAREIADGAMMDFDALPRTFRI